MSSIPVPKDHSRPLPVVRCDRGNPCGNCQDNNTTCTRQRVIKRTRKTTRLAVVENIVRTPSSPQATPNPQDSQNSSPGLPDFSSSNGYSSLEYQQSHGESPSSDKPLSLYDAQATIQYHLDHLEWLTINRRQILESGLELASQLSDSFEDPVHVGSDITTNEEQIRSPSFELLTWMLKDIKEANFGSFVRDYFRHISEATLMQMGLALLQRTGSPHDLLINTVCVNAIASKFLAAITNTGIDSELIHEMTHNIVQFQEAAKVALRSISHLNQSFAGTLTGASFWCEYFQSWEECIGSNENQIFLHQASGDITVCWELTKAACRKFCFQDGRSKTLLDIEIGHFISDQPGHQHPTSDLFQIYMTLARVQAALVPYLRGRSSILTGDLSSSHGIGKLWLVNMQQIRERIDHISSPYPAWRGLDAQSEISALQFAYHSIMTTIFHITEGAGHQSVDIRDQCLFEAHQGISSLVSTCISAERQNTVALLHWTLLVCPITAYFVLFCNVIATSNTDDFKLMTTITDCLTRIETTSRPIIQVRTIFRHFLSLAGEVFDDESNAIVVTRDHQVQPVQSQSTDLHNWLSDGLFIPWTAGTVPPFDPPLLTGMGDFSDIPIFPENEMFIPLSDHFPDAGNDPSV
ncbi:hypothetical protein N7453_001628 [Penicillium expansum]|nr:hypothetical protein N7453_001628 [Penicillium expansum]